MILRAGIRAVLLCCFLAAVSLAQVDRIGARIDARRSVLVKGTAPAMAQAAYDRGAVEPGFRLRNVTLMLGPSTEQQAALEQLLAEQQDPASPNYHKWLTPETYAERFAMSSGDLADISAWLRSQGFVVEYTARGRDFISFSGTAAQVRQTLHTEIHRYRIGAETHFANSADLSLPAAIEPMVTGVLGLDDFRPWAPRKPLQPNFTAAQGGNYLLPDDIATIYNVGPLYGYGYSGAGQSIAIVGQSDIDPNDIAVFRSLWGLPPTTIQMIAAGSYPGFTGDEVEADLDLQWAGAVARDSTLIYVYSDDASYSAYYAIDNNLAPVISESFGLCESRIGRIGRGLYYNQIEAQKANAMGITWVASSGDSGAAGCDYAVATASRGLAVSAPASVPEVTAVGGTAFDEGGASYWGGNGLYGGSALSYIPERAWNDTDASVALGGTIGASGGGVSSVFRKPGWQKGPGVPNDGMRDLPDVSLAASSAHDPYLVISAGTLFTVGGTSAAAPCFAGILALLNQFLVQNNVQAKSGVGNINPKLYGLAASATPAVFHDVTAGDNIVPCQEGTPDCVEGKFGYTAGPAYDLVTGLGSVDAYNLVTTLSGIPVSATTMTLSATPAVISSAGYSVLTTTVKAASGTASPTGTVSFTLNGSMVGGGQLSGSGGTSTASIKIFGGQLLAAANTIQASYSGSPTFTASSASAALTLGAPPAASAVTVSVNPNPVYQHTADADDGTFSFTIQLNETAGVDTTVTGFTFSGVNLAGSVASFFGGNTLPANGSLTATLKANNVPAPSVVVMVFTGRDAGGAMWTRQVAIPFLPQQTTSTGSGLPSARARLAVTGSLPYVIPVNPIK
jgi:subtilase family serine protease